MKTKLIFIYFMVCLLNIRAFSDEMPTARELLIQFSKSRKNLSSFIVTGRVKSTYTYSGFDGVGISFVNFENRYDGNRVKNISSKWGDINIKVRDVKEEDADYHSNLWDGQTAYTYGDGKNPLVGKHISGVIVDPDDHKKSASESFKRTFFGQVMGYHQGDDAPIQELFLRPSVKLQLQEKRSNLREVDCYVLEADVPGYGKYTVWIDPVHDLHIARIRVQRESGDRLGRLILKEKETYKDLFEVLEFEKNGNAWFPKTCKAKKVFNSVNRYSNYEKEISFSMITLAPDHDALGSFLPDDIPNGTPADLRSRSHREDYIWQDGKVVDSEGKVVFEPSDHKSLAGRIK